MTDREEGACIACGLCVWGRKGGVVFPALTGPAVPARAEAATAAAPTAG